MKPLSTANGLAFSHKIPVEMFKNTNARWLLCATGGLAGDIRELLPSLRNFKAVQASEAALNHARCAGSFQRNGLNPALSGVSGANCLFPYRVRLAGWGGPR